MSTRTLKRTNSQNHKINNLRKRQISLIILKVVKVVNIKIVTTNRKEKNQKQNQKVALIQRNQILVNSQTKRVKMTKRMVVKRIKMVILMMAILKTLTKVKNLSPIILPKMKLCPRRRGTLMKICKRCILMIKNKIFI